VGTPALDRCANFSYPTGRNSLAEQSRPANRIPKLSPCAAFASTCRTASVVRAALSPARNSRLTGGACPSAFTFIATIARAIFVVFAGSRIAANCRHRTANDARLASIRGSAANRLYISIITIALNKLMQFKTQLDGFLEKLFRRMKYIKISFYLFSKSEEMRRPKSEIVVS
jgi:hypothetical protein